MARRSKFTTPDAAASWAISKGAPARGNKWPITSATRGLVKFWLTASGVSSERAGTLTLAEMTDAWHDLSGATLLRLAAVPAPVTPETPSPIITEEPEPMPMQHPFVLTPPPVQPKPALDQDARMKALLEILQPQAPALDEAAIVDIMTRTMGHAISSGIDGAVTETRAALADLLEEARAIVNGAPRILKIDIAGRIKEMPAAARHPMFDTLLTLAVVSKEPNAKHPMLVGPAGGGKTTAAEQVAQALGLPFFSNGALSGTHELTGYEDAAGKYHATAFRTAFEHGGVYLADEMDRSDPAAVLALNSALANRFMAFPDRAEPVRAHERFYVIAACNTYGRGADRIYIGANQMDGSSLDRFGTLTWDYDETLERSIAGDDAWTAYVQAARSAAADLKIRHVISPRASYYGATLRRAGLAFDMVAEIALWKGLDREQRERITARIPDRIATRAQAPVLHAIAAE